MSSDLKITPEGRRTLIESAIRNLVVARNLLALADTPRTLPKVRSALKSAEGALRNAQSHEARAYRMSDASKNTT
jgi:hypothetical protein